MEYELDMTRGVYRRIYAGATRGRRINRVSMVAELVFWRIHLIADDFGCFEADPELVKSGAMPIRREIEPAQIADSLVELSRAGLIGLYEVNGEPYGEILGFEQLQPANRNGRRIRRYPQRNTGESDGIQGNPDASGKSCASDTDTEAESNTEDSDAGASVSVSPDSPPDERRGVSPPLGYGDATQPVKVPQNGQPSPAIPKFPQGMIRFWDAYPKQGKDRSGRPSVATVWKRLGLEDQVEAVMAGLERWKASEAWQKDGGQFIPGAHRWLAKLKWQDTPAGGAREETAERRRRAVAAAFADGGTHAAK